MPVSSTAFARAASTDSPASVRTTSQSRKLVGSGGSGPQDRTSSLTRVARLSGNVGQPNHVLANEIAGHKAERRSALWQVLDVVKARAALTNFVEFLYKQLQFALRETVGTRTLDELLGEKGVLDREIGDAVRAQVQEHGLAVHSVGIKDVILPGEMKGILNQVVQAEKLAQANLIKRREETAATRALLNTARLMDENPTLLRMKELETLEKVTEKIDKLTVFGGLEGVLKDVVRIQVPSA
jgi:hypothetical protein